MRRASSWRARATQQIHEIDKVEGVERTDSRATLLPASIEFLGQLVASRRYRETEREKGAWNQNEAMENQSGRSRDGPDGNSDETSHPLEKRCPLENRNGGDRIAWGILRTGSVQWPVRFLPLDSPARVSFVPFDLFLQSSPRVV